MKSFYILIIFLFTCIFTLIIYNNFQNKSTLNTTAKEIKSNSKKLIMAHNLPQNSALHDASVLFSKLVYEKTNGSIQIEIYPNQKLGSDYQMVEMARNGEIDILLTPTAKMSVTVPSLQYADLPFLFPTREDAYELLDGEPGKMILKKLESFDLYGVSFWENGFKHFTANEPLLEPKDFKNKKIRVMKSRIIMEQFNALNAIAIPIDFHSTKQALADKVVDGQENPLVAIVNMRFHEVQKNMTLSEHAYLPYLFSISRKSLEKLSEYEQDILINTGIEVTSWEREETQKREKDFLKTVIDAGVKVDTLSSSQREVFAEKTKYIIPMYEDIIGSDIISKTQELLYKKYPPKDTIVFGINVDISGQEKKSGLAIKRGVELALDEINTNGGLLGKKVIAIAKNNKAISTQGKNNIKEFILDDNVKGIIGGKHSAIIANSKELIIESKKPYLIPWASADILLESNENENYLFRVSAKNSFLIKSLYNEVLKSNNKPLVVVENSIWGRESLNLLKNSKIESFVLNRGETSFSDILNLINEKDIDSLMLVLNTAEANGLISQLDSNKIDLPIVSHWGVIGDGFYKKNKQYIDRNKFKFIQSFKLDNNKNKKAKKVLNSYIKKYGIKNESMIFAPSAVIQAYDATNLLALAIQNSNSFDGEKIKDALENIDIYKGALKTYIKPFNKYDHEALEKKDFYIAKFDKNGKIVLVKEIY